MYGCSSTPVIVNKPSADLAPILEKPRDKENEPYTQSESHYQFIDEVQSKSKNGLNTIGQKNNLIGKDNKLALTASDVIDNVKLTDDQSKIVERTNNYDSVFLLQKYHATKDIILDSFSQLDISNVSLSVERVTYNLAPETLDTASIYSAFQYKIAAARVRFDYDNDPFVFKFYNTVGSMNNVNEGELSNGVSNKFYKNVATIDDTGFGLGYIQKFGFMDMVYSAGLSAISHKVNINLASAPNAILDSNANVVRLNSNLFNVNLETQTKISFLKIHAGASAHYFLDNARYYEVFTDGQGILQRNTADDKILKKQFWSAYIGIGISTNETL